jgi:hypothetical protein
MNLFQVNLSLKSLFVDAVELMTDPMLVFNLC